LRAPGLEQCGITGALNHEKNRNTLLIAFSANGLTDAKTLANKCTHANCHCTSDVDCTCDGHDHIKLASVKGRHGGKEDPRVEEAREKLACLREKDPDNEDAIAQAKRELVAQI